MSTQQGLKYDGGKARFSLLRFGCARALQGIAEVLTFGAKKYADHSWQNVTGGVDRYWSALERHLNAIAAEGLQARDEESGLLHIDHVNTNGLFLAELIRKQATQVDPKVDGTGEPRISDHITSDLAKQIAARIKGQLPGRGGKAFAPCNGSWEVGTDGSVKP